MKHEHALILARIHDLLDAHPELRFGQALHALGINEFAHTTDGRVLYMLRDIFNDPDAAILARMRDPEKRFSTENCKPGCHGEELCEGCQTSENWWQQNVRPKDFADTISDGFGSEWPITCPSCGERAMQVVRPGSAACSHCNGRVN